MKTLTFLICALVAGVVFGVPYLARADEASRALREVAVAAPPAIVQSRTTAGSTGTVIFAGSSTASYATVAVSSVATIGGQGTQHVLMVSCADENTCTFLGDAAKSREVLERIADQSVQIDVVIDQNCRPQREIIRARRVPEAVASLSP